MKNFIKISIIVVIALGMFLPLTAQATTLKQYEDQVAKYTAELKEKQAKMAKNAAEIKEIKGRISVIEGQIKEAGTQIQTLQEEIVRSNQEIEQKGEESKSIMVYYQLANGDNAYLQYAFGAETITDMIYRASIAEQLTEYNDKIMKELQELIEYNKNKTVEIEAKREELKGLEKSLKTEKEKIELENVSISNTIPSVEEQIKVAQNQVDYWKGKGCKSNDILGVTCAVPPKVTPGGGVNIGNIMGANGFRIPMDHGYLTQGFSGKNGHMGVDFGSTNKSEPIYPVANGLVIYVGVDSYGANVVKIVHNVNGQLIFSTYAHMRAVYFSKGQTVTTADMLGLMGSTGWSTGPHLHLEMTTCDWTYNCTYKTYKNSLVNPYSYIPNASRW